MPVKISALPVAAALTGAELVPVVQSSVTDQTTVGKIADFANRAYQYLTSEAGTNTLTATGPVSMTAYAVGQVFTFLPQNTNTGATTINITPSGGAALGAKSIFCNGIALVAGEIKISVPCMIEYDGTQFNILGPFVAGTIPGNVAIGGTITPSQTNGIVGTTTNNNANALSVGEYVSGTLAVGSATSLSTGTAKTIISISLTAGDWDVAATGYILPAATTQVASVASSISQTNNTLDTANGSIVVNALGNMVVATFSTEHGVPVVPVRISLSGTTTIYLVMSATFSVSTMTAYGNIRARRVR